MYLFSKQNTQAVAARRRSIGVRRVLVPTIAILYTVTADIAGADSRLVFSSKSGQQPATTKTLIVKDGRVGFITNDNGSVYAIFDQKQSAFAFINHSDRQYTIISKTWMEEMHKRSQESAKRIQEQLDKQLQSMPPQQRAMYQQGRMMLPMMAPYMSNLARPNYLRTAVPLYITRSINNISCNRVDLLEGGRKTLELCVAQRDQLTGLSNDDYGTMLSMLQVAQELDTLGAFALGFKRPFLAAWGGGSPGLPIAVTEHSGTLSTATELKKFDTEPVDTEQLQLPQDYLQAQIPMPIR